MGEGTTEEIAIVNDLTKHELEEPRDWVQEDADVLKRRPAIEWDHGALLSIPFETE